MSKPPETEEELRKEMETIDNAIDLLKSQHKLHGCKCCICKKTGCNVISFMHKKPAHSSCCKIVK